VAKPLIIELTDGTEMPILYEDRSVMAVDKPAGWVVSAEWQTNPDTNLQLFLQASLFNGDFWAKSRNLKFIRFVHRLDSMTSGVLLLSKSNGAIGPLSRLFETGATLKEYLAIVDGIPNKSEWAIEMSMAKDPDNPKVMAMSRSPEARESYTEFRVLATSDNRSVIHARPFTGRTHQIRLHLAQSRFPIAGDNLYNPIHKSHKFSGPKKKTIYPLGLRAIRLSYPNPFEKKIVRIKAATAGFLDSFGFAVDLQVPFWDAK
jgi:RluA family pseudouridine synthase